MVVIVILLAASICVGLGGLLPYILSTLSGKTRPRLVSWGTWELLAIVLTVSALIEGHIESAILSIEGVLGCGVVFIVGWRKGSRDVNRFDLICLIGALAGIFVLVVLRDPAMAMLLSISIDGLAFLPTFYHGWRRPREERIISYVGNFSASALVIIVAAIRGQGMMGFAYPLYSIGFNIAMAIMLVLGGKAIMKRLRPAGPEVFVRDDAL